MARPLTEFEIWIKDYDHVTELGYFLAHEECLNAEQLQRYYEKPWKWESEWREMKNAQKKAQRESRNVAR